jgi:hypothetical protein
MKAFTLRNFTALLRTYLAAGAAHEVNTPDAVQRAGPGHTKRDSPPPRVFVHPRVFKARYQLCGIHMMCI